MVASAYNYTLFGVLTGSEFPAPPLPNPRKNAHLAPKTLKLFFAPAGVMLLIPGRGALT